MTVATIFPFVFLRRGYREWPAYRTAITEQGAGLRVAQRLHAAEELVARGTLLFPNAGGSWSDFLAFWRARFGAWGAFLFKPQDTDAAAIEDAFTATTGQTDFAASRRYVDTATVVVKKAGVTQTLTTHYTLENESGGTYVLGTSTQLVVAFLSAPGNGVAVNVAYEHYVPVRFEGDDLDDQELHAAGRGGSGVADRSVQVQLREAAAGASYASAPNVL